MQRNAENQHSETLFRGNRRYEKCDVEVFGELGDGGNEAENQSIHQGTGKNGSREKVGITILRENRGFRVKLVTFSQDGIILIFL